MREGALFHYGEGRARSAMLGMTMAASQGGIVVHHGSMHRRRVPHLLRNIRVARRTTVRHCLRRPGGDVAGFTFAGRLGMRPDTAQHLIPVCAQRSRVIYQAAARIRVARDRYGREQRGQDACP